MRTTSAGFVFCLALVMLAATGFSSGDVPASKGSLGDKRGNDLSNGPAQAAGPLACGCPDLADTELFASKGLGYVKSAEFAEALQAVANGQSVYSPQEMPTDWSATAAGWRAYIAARPAGGQEPARPAGYPISQARLDPDLFIGKEACSPSLLYLASLEYRSRMGHQGVKPVFPRLVRIATNELGATIVAKNRMTAAFETRSAGIMNKIVEAERMGAGECQPNELANARSELDRARRAASGIRAGVLETDAAFVRAEQAASALLTKRRYALQKGFKCLPE